MSYLLKMGLLVLLGMSFSYGCIADTPVDTHVQSTSQPAQLQTTTSPTPAEISAIQERAREEAQVKNNPFIISFYKPTYVLPYYYTASPDNRVYEGATPNNQSIKSSEAKYQFSLKVPVVSNFINDKNMIYLAYTQLSYWQVYSKSAFFRETDYEPELFLSHKLKYYLGKGWFFDFVNFGAVHQSNGYGGSMERTWNRIYVEGILSNEHWMLRIKPWYVIHDSSYNTYNPDLAHYLGYGQVVVAYQNKRQQLALLAHSFFHGNRSTVELSYSFPLTVHLNGYVQLFSGYGQSLIEYNHRTNSAGIGISLSNWI